jgi:hypothetical protein
LRELRVLSSEKASVEPELSPSRERAATGTTAFGRSDVAVAVGLVAGAAALRVAPLGPPSLWLDDSWPTLVVKADTVHETLLAGAWAPGFILLMKGWLTTFGFSELTAQLLPFFIGIATPPFLYVVLRKRGIRRLASAAGAFVLLTSSVHIVYSARVKQYTLDAFCVVALIAVTWWLLEDVRDRRRWWWLALAAVAAIAFSSSSAVVACTCFVMAFLVLFRADRREIPTALVPASIVAFFAAAWWWFLLRPRVTSTLREDFRATFFGLDEGLEAAVRDLAGAAAVVVRGAVELPDGTEAFVVVAAAAIVLWRRAQLGVLFLAPLGLAALLGAGKVAPLGTGRTDIYLYPLLATLVAVAVHEGLTVAPKVTSVTVTALGALSLVTFSPTSYPQEAVRPLVEEIERRAAPADAVVVYPKSAYPFALYTSLPVDLIESAVSQQGFAVRVRRPNVFILEGAPGEAVEAAIERMSRGHETAWVLFSHGRPSDRIRRLLVEHGYTKRSLRRMEGASLERWSMASQ